MDDLLLESFARAVVTIHFEDGTRVLHPQPAGDVGSDFPYPHPVHIVTAYNPGGRVGDATSNAAGHRLLVAAVAELGAPSVATVGSAADGSIPEPGLLIAGLSRRVAIDLGRRFGQRAIYEWSHDRLEILGVAEPAAIALGWRLANDTTARGDPGVGTGDPSDA